MTVHIEPDFCCGACGALVTEDAEHCDRCFAMLPVTPPSSHVVKPRPRPRVMVSEDENEDDYGPEPEYNDRLITIECKPCQRCGIDFKMGETARVWGTHRSWSRYHLACWPWSA